MNKHDAEDYSFLALEGRTGGLATTLAYLVGLVDSPDHKITDPISAKRILAYMFEVEEQAQDAVQLLDDQRSFFARYFPGGYYPQSTVLLTESWSPIGAMLERAMIPTLLKREDKVRAAATGIWNPVSIVSSKSLEACPTDEELFWAILAEVSRRAVQRRMWVSVIAKPGWSYDSNVGKLQKWSANEIVRADRIVWKRTAKCP